MKYFFNNLKKKTYIMFILNKKQEVLEHSTDVKIKQIVSVYH